jgi:hypothetical protein
MAGITDLADLYVAASEYVKEADFGHLFDRFVAFTELEIERNVLLEGQHGTSTLTLVNGRANIPTDFSQVRAVRTVNEPYLNLKRISKQLETGSGLECEYGYTFDGSEIVVFPTTTGSVKFDYYKKIPRLTDVAPTNWLLDQAPDVLLSGVIYQVLMWKGDERTEGARADFYTRMKSVQGKETFGRMSNSRVTTSRSMP